MSIFTAGAIAQPNIAFIKYWGNRDHRIRLPSNGSISMTLEKLETRTVVTFDPNLDSDELILNGNSLGGSSLSRVSEHLNVMRQLADLSHLARVVSESNFPIGTGIASSASGFAALTVAACAALNLNLTNQELSRIARHGSGSACRSIFGGYVEWNRGENDSDSHAFPIAGKEHWELHDLIAIVEKDHKSTGSTSGHRLADTSSLQPVRVEDCERRLRLCRKAILERDFPTLASISEEDSNMMHAVMMTSNPPLLYWRPGTVEIMLSVIDWRRDGIEVFYTIDAGPNVHCICTKASKAQVRSMLQDLPGVIDIIEASTGDDAYEFTPI